MTRLTHRWAFAAITAVGALAALGACSKPSPPPARGRRVQVDRRIELVAIVERLAGEPEYVRAPHTAYVADLDRAFAPYATHPVVAATRALHDVHSISFDAPMELAVQLDDQLALRGAPGQYDARWSGVDVAAYVAQLQDFARVAKLDAFLAAHREYLTAVEQRFERALDRERPEAWFATFFGAPGAQFVVVPGLLEGPMNYGVRSSDAMYQVIGLAAPDAAGLPVIDEPTLELLVHEMAHSFINPLFERHLDELLPAGTALMPFVAQAMKDNHYRDARTLLFESGVRAVTALYVRDHQRTAPPDIFPWTGDLAGLLARYRTERARYKDLDAFVPEIAAFFADRARQLTNQLSR